MFDRIGNACYRLKKLVRRHLLLCLAALITGALLLQVPQVWYAFAVPGCFEDVPGTLLGILLTVLLVLVHGTTLLLLIGCSWPGLRRFFSPASRDVLTATIVWPVRAVRSRFRLAWCAAVVVLLAAAQWLAGVHTFWLSLVFLVWLGYLWRHGFAAMGTVQEAQGWLLGWTITTYLAGEAIWVAANAGILGSLQPALGYLFYTRWGILQITFLLLNVACLVDYWDRHSKVPVRILTCGLLAIGVIRGMMPERVREVRTSLASVVPEGEVSRPAESAAPAASEASVASRSTAWERQIRARLAAAPPGPVVLVAASGGGSRAALFTSLVLEGMAREKSQDDRRLSEHVVLISSVSGGSLATAYFLANGDVATDDTEASQHSSRPELLALVDQILEEEPEFQDPAPAGAASNPEAVVRSRSIGQAKRVVKLLREEPDNPEAQRAAWVFSNRFSDEMSADFMAPILRGAMLPGMDRGASLEEFWQGRFQWKEITTAPRARGDGQARGNSTAPVVFFNACHTSWGTRFVIDFPPLPPKFFAAEQTLGTPSRHPIRAVSDLERPPVVTLAQAVRFSSNFPWGFPVRSLRGVHLLDGGIVDNTGIDTIYEVFHRLEASESGRAVLRDLARRGVLLLEIDSGGKPAGQQRMPPQTAGVMEPLAACNAALYTNADIIKQFYVSEIDRILSGAMRDSVLAKAGRLRTDSARLAVKTFAETFPRVTVHYTFQCEHFGAGHELPSRRRSRRAGSVAQQQSVMTAWALSAEHKARVLTRFLIELNTWETELEEQRNKLVQTLAQVGELEAEVDRLLAAEEESKLPSRSVGRSPDGLKSTEVLKTTEQGIARQLERRARGAKDFARQLDQLQERFNRKSALTGQMAQ